MAPGIEWAVFFHADLGMMTGPEPDRPAVADRPTEQKGSDAFEITSEQVVDGSGRGCT